MSGAASRGRRRSAQCGRRSRRPGTLSACRCEHRSPTAFAFSGASRSCAPRRSCTAAGNFALPGVLFVVLVLGKRHGLTGGEVGSLLAAFGVCTLLGSLASPLFRRALSLRAILLLELWAWLGTIAFLVVPNVYVLLGSILPLAVTLPVTDSVVEGYRVAITPDRMLGRVESVRTNISLLASARPAHAAGFLLESFSARATVAVFTAWMSRVALYGTLSPSIQKQPSLDELAEHA